MSLCVFAVVAYTMFILWLYREVQVMESQGGSGATEGGGGDGQSGQAASTALIEKILSEEPRWQGKSLARHTQRFHKQGKLPLHHLLVIYTQPSSTGTLLPQSITALLLLPLANQRWNENVPSLHLYNFYTDANAE